MRWPILATLLAFATALVPGTAGAATPFCKQGQKTTKAKPCLPRPVRIKPVTSSSQPDPGDTGTRSEQTDAVTIVRFLDPSENKYQLELQNTSAIGYINTFNWVPPVGMTITAITSSEGGRCHIAPTPTGATMITCVAGQKGIPPPACICIAGGDMTVNFTATTTSPPSFNGQYWTYYGIVGASTSITSMTPVPYHIPSFQGGQAPDLPPCGTNEKSTAAHPCTSQPG